MSFAEISGEDTLKISQDGEIYTEIHKSVANSVYIHKRALHK